MSWLDRLLDALERSRIPASLLCFALAAVLGSLSAALRWWDGTYPFPEVAPITTVFACAGAYALWVLVAIRRSARQGLREFEPALGELAPRHPEFERRLTTMTPAQSIVAVVVGLIPPLVGNLAGGWGISDRTSLLTNLYTVGVQVFLNVLVIAYFIRVGRLLRAIVEIHRDATGIRLADPAHNAFSRVTFRAAVLIVVPYAVIEVIAWSLGEATAVELVMLGLLLVASIAVFVLPLWGMHRRLVDLKRRELARIESAFDVASAELVGAVVTGTDAGLPSASVGALGVARDRVRHLSAWPWSPEALRGFVTSIALPLLLWLGTPLLDVVFA